MVRQVGIRIERNSQLQLAQSLLRLVVQQQSLAEDAVLGRSRRILLHRQPQFVDRRAS